MLRSSGIFGYLTLRFLAALKIIRRVTLRFEEETTAIENWLDLVLATARQNPQLALEIAKCQQLITGYGETRERGFTNYKQIVSTLAVLHEKTNGTEIISQLRAAALEEESGAAVEKLMTKHGLVAGYG